MTEYWLAYAAGSTIGGVLLWGLIVWLVGLFAFKKRSKIERARLLPASVWLAASALWFINGRGHLALVFLPSFLLIWAIRHYLATRRAEPVKHHSWWTE